MKRKGGYSIKAMVLLLTATVLMLTGCGAGDEAGTETGPVETVYAHLNFSLPSRIVGKRHISSTRMADDVVQASGKEEDFRGLDDVHLLCFNQPPTATSQKLGNVIEMKTAGDEVLDSAITSDDYSLSQELSIPVGTSYFSFYARSADNPLTHEERMKYGVIETVGLGRSTYQGNSGIRFRPVPICNSTEPLGGSAKGQALLAMLNDLMNTTVADAAPNDSFATANNLWLNEAYQRLTTLKTLSSTNVQTLLGVINKMVNQEAPDAQGALLVAAINTKMAAICATAPGPNDDQITLKEQYLGFPDDIHLPAGAARIEWNLAQKRFEVPDSQAYGKKLDVMSINDYAYPMNLQYQVFSDIVVSDTLVLKSETEDGPVAPDSAQYKSWVDVIRDGYQDAQKVVQQTTQSVALVKQVQYAVGRLALQARLTTDNIYDAKGNYVPVSNGTFTLKGYIVGGQREVDYDFQPVPGSKEYAIYDTELNGGPQPLMIHDFSEADYILGLGTSANQNILLAMELVNNGQAFQGADGVIAPGATFYLVADMVPQEGQGYTSGSLDQIFSKDRATKVYLTITSLASATYGLPDLEIPRPTVGVSVDLTWGEGLWFPDVVL